jgi:heterodisulfide reductase subunit A
MPEEYLTFKVDAIVVSTGATPHEGEQLKEYGYNKFANVITALEYERMLSASGPTHGKIMRPSDGRLPHRIAFIQCVGARDDRELPYCSAICCMYASKEAILSKEHMSELEVYIFYTDLRAMGKQFYEYIVRARERYGIVYIRSKPGKIEEDKDRRLIIWYEDTTTQRVKQIVVDMVILCPPLISELKSVPLIDIKLDEYGFPVHYHPLDTSVKGIFVCGFSHSPQDIPEAVIQGSAVAARIAELLQNV